MTDELEIELQILNFAHDYINSRATEVIKDLTEKALSLNIEEKDRRVILGERRGIQNFLVALNERRLLLRAQKQKES